MKWVSAVGLLLVSSSSVQAIHHHHHIISNELLQQGDTYAKGGAKTNGEAKVIEEKASAGLKELESEDASLSDMMQFSKAVASGKSAADMIEEEDTKAHEYETLQKEIEKQKVERLALINQKTDYEIEEEQSAQHAIDITERRMLI